ncbi:L,D-transpeptidase family protein [Flavobacterium tegetincola]|uniref:L,D-transpeptidase family protein n=1 Tax=Flavobacterium tegetincola TaxID=150172 RepID=UPI000406B13A|nr:L,D-transpeptidase family protein [Flavobacterium tegetincola]
MKSKYVIIVGAVLILGVILMLWQCKAEEPIVVKQLELKLDQPDPELKPFDSTGIATFYKTHPELVKYQEDVLAAYRNHKFNYLWHDSKGRKETAEVLYNRINSIAEEGITEKLPYKEAFDLMWYQSSATDLTGELLLTNYYFFYTDKVLAGTDQKKREEMGWFLERKPTSYVAYLDTLLANPGLVHKKTQLNKQYYQLKKALEQYRIIAKNGGWDSIVLPEEFKSLRFKDSSALITQIRKRLFISGDLKEDSGSGLFDKSLIDAVSVFQRRHGFLVDKTLGKNTIGAMNVSVADRIKTIMINMERCRWISPTISQDKEYIVVNIPAYQLTYIKNDSVVLQSDVVVGTTVHQTVIFSGKMKYVVFSPYWNIPQSIIKNEVLPGIQKNSNYLANHNMEWNNGQVRQKPGVRNSLGLVKFIFPNSNNIYLHDTPSKSLFQRETRAFSHGCIRVAKPKDLAEHILADDSNWSPEKIDAAMHKGTEKWYPLKSEIPVYIGYFTAWMDRSGNLNFYEDVYKRDAQMESLLIQNE